MRSAFAAVGLAAVAAALPQGDAVTAAISPSTTAAAGCSPDYNGGFQIQLLNASSVNKRSLESRQSDNGKLVINLKGGVLTDAQGRIGYIAANRQFQFDGPPQAGAIYTAGWTVCQNNSLAIGNDALFKACLSGTFYNLYDQNGAPQCDSVYIQVYGAGSSGSGAGQQGDGQPTGSPVSQIGDGQPQATGAVTQIGDGQVQAPSAAVTQIGDGQIQAPNAPATQIGDGQVQAPSAAATQIGDGQVQAPSAAATQIGDGQVQAPSAAATQIGDGQVQAPSAAATQIGDGQVQAPTAAATQIGDGQVQAPGAGNGTVAQASPSAQPYTGAASSVNGVAFSLVAAVVMAVAML